MKTLHRAAVLAVIWGAVTWSMHGPDVAIAAVIFGTGGFFVGALI